MKLGDNVRCKRYKECSNISCLHYKIHKYDNMDCDLGWCGSDDENESWCVIDISETRKRKLNKINEI